MRYAVIISIYFLCIPMTILAESRFVTEIRDIMFRTGPGNEYRITNTLKTGTQVEIISETEEWAQIRLPNGKEGWVLNRYLQSEPPSGNLLLELQADYKVINETAENLKTENKDLIKKIGELTHELKQHQETITTLKESYENLKQESADFLALQSDYSQTKDALKQQREKAQTCENELAKLYNDNRLKWFLIGAGVLLGGIVLGFVTKPQRRKSKLL